MHVPVGEAVISTTEQRIESPMAPVNSVRPLPGGAVTLAPSGGRVNRGRRVLLLLEDLGGGTGNHVCQLISSWIALGWETMVVTQNAPLVHRLPAGVEVRVITRRSWYDRFPLAQLRRLLELRRVVRAFQPDVVHTYFFWSIVYGRVLKLLGDVRLLVENREDLGFSWTPGDYRILRSLRSVPDRVVCVAEAVRDVVVRRERIDPRRITVVRNGVAPGATNTLGRVEARRGLGFSDEHVVIGMVANLPRAVKGGRQLLDVIGDIVAACPRARFLLVGLGTEPATLAAELASRGIAQYVVGAGYRRDIDDCYAAMDISVLTSSTEGLSITLLESMKHGLPTVVTRVGGNSELVVEGETGFLVELGDTRAFVERVVALARDPGLRRSLGDAGRRRVGAEFALAGVARKYLNLYEQLLEENRPLHAMPPEPNRREEIAV